MARSRTYKKRKHTLRACAPTRRKSDDDGRDHAHSCFTLSELREIASARELTFSKKSTLESLTKLIERASGTRDEYAWIEGARMTAARARALTRRMRPKVPTAWAHVTAVSDTWLTNVDIENVVRQYEDTDSAFKFLGVATGDLRRCAACNVRHTADDDGGDEIHQTCRSMLNVDPKSFIARGIHKVACVLNTGPHDSEGEHWVACYVDFTMNAACYYDPIGCSQSEDVSVYFDLLDMRMENRLERMVFDGTREGAGTHQRPGTSGECGVYCIHFIERMLDASASRHEAEFRSAFDAFVRADIPHEFAVELRRRYFYDPHDVVATIEAQPIIIDESPLTDVCRTTPKYA